MGDYTDMTGFYTDYGIEMPDNLIPISGSLDLGDTFNFLNTTAGNFSGLTAEERISAFDEQSRTESENMGWDNSARSDLQGFNVGANNEGFSGTSNGSGGGGFLQGLANLFNGSNPANKGLLQSMLTGLGGVYKDINLKEIAQMGIDSNERRDTANNLTAIERQKLINSGSIEGINANNAAAMERQRLQMEAIKQRQTDLNNSIQPTKWSA